MNLFKMERYFQLTFYGYSFLISKFFFFFLISKIGSVLQLLLFTACFLLTAAVHKYDFS